MRIGIEAQRIFRPNKHGMDIYALQLIKHLQQIDQINEYFIFVRPGKDKCLQTTHNFQIIEIEAINYFDWEQVWLPLNIREYKLDILHCTSNTAPLMCVVPIVVTIHDIIYLNNSFVGGSFYQQLGHYYRKWVVPKVFHRAHKVMTVSNFEAQTISNFFNNVDKLEVTYNGINPIFLTKLTKVDLSIEKKSLTLPEKYLLFLGNTAPKKNMGRVLKAYCQYQNHIENPIPLVIVETKKEIVLKMLEEIGSVSSMEHIYCTGYIENDKLPKLYQNACLFLYPSLRESFGIPIIEAMASGTPVLTSSTSSMPEIAQDAAYYVDPYSTHLLTAKMIELLLNESKLQKKISKGHERVQQFTWAKTAQQVLNCYNDVFYKKVALQEAS